MENLAYKIGIIFFHSKKNFWFYQNYHLLFFRTECNITNWKIFHNIVNVVFYINFESIWFYLKKLKIISIEIYYYHNLPFISLVGIIWFVFQQNINICYISYYYYNKLLSHINININWFLSDFSKMSSILFSQMTFFFIWYELSSALSYKNN